MKRIDNLGHKNQVAAGRKSSDLESALKKAKADLDSGRIRKKDVRDARKAQNDLNRHPLAVRAMEASLGKRRLATLRTTLREVWQRIRTGRIEAVDGYEFVVLEWAATARMAKGLYPTTEEMVEIHLHLLVHLAAEGVYGRSTGGSSSGPFEKVEILQAKLVRNGWTSADVLVTEVDTLIDLQGADGPDEQKPNHPGRVSYQVPGMCRINLVCLARQGSLAGKLGVKRVITFNKLVRHPFYQYGNTANPIDDDSENYILKTRGVNLG